MKLLHSSAAAFSLRARLAEKGNHLSVAASATIKTRAFFLLAWSVGDGDGDSCLAYERIVVFAWRF